MSIIFIFFFENVTFEGVFSHFTIYLHKRMVLTDCITDLEKKNELESKQGLKWNNIYFINRDIHNKLLNFYQFITLKMRMCMQFIYIYAYACLINSFWKLTNISELWSVNPCIAIQLIMLPTTRRKLPIRRGTCTHFCKICICQLARS